MAEAWEAYSNCCSIRALTISIIGNSLSLSLNKKTATATIKNKKHLPLIHDCLRNFDLFCKCGIKKSALYKPSSDIEFNETFLLPFFSRALCPGGKRETMEQFSVPQLIDVELMTFGLPLQNVLPLS